MTDESFFEQCPADRPRAAGETVWPARADDERGGRQAGASGVRRPERAFGPGIHIELGTRLLDELARAHSPKGFEKEVLTHPDHFLYGNIAADIINFKNYGGVKNHCHNWNIQARMEAHIERDTERAFLMGYLCHLAADVTAHNHFVPYHLLHGLPPRFLNHPYWEALADGGIDDRTWEIVARLKRNRSLHRNDLLIHRAVRWKILGLRRNKWIFNNILLLNLRQSWRDLVRGAHSRKNRYPLNRDFLARCIERAYRDMKAVFSPDGLLVLELRDPTGRAALRAAPRLRREVLRRHGNLAEARQASIDVAEAAFGRPGSSPFFNPAAGRARPGIREHHGA